MDVRIGFSSVNTAYAKSRIEPISSSVLKNHITMESVVAKDKS
jgi:hypothetical protein